jgi:hypothetical protein
MIPAGMIAGKPPFGRSRIRQNQGRDDCHARPTIPGIMSCIIAHLIRQAPGFAISSRLLSPFPVGRLL